MLELVLTLRILQIGNVSFGLFHSNSSRHSLFFVVVFWNHHCNYLNCNHRHDRLHCDCLNCNRQRHSCPIFHCYQRLSEAVFRRYHRRFGPAFVVLLQSRWASFDFFIPLTYLPSFFIKLFRAYSRNGRMRFRHFQYRQTKWLGKIFLWFAGVVCWGEATPAYAVNYFATHDWKTHNFVEDVFVLRVRSGRAAGFILTTGY